MRKGWIVLLTAVLVVAFAAPAMADLKVTGFYRAKAMLSSFFDGAGGPSIRTSEEEQSNSYVEQRGHLKFEMGTADVKAVFHFESDMTWGVNSAAVARNSGGALSADSVQLETKNVYVWFKIPDTSLQAKVGVQGFADKYGGIFSNSADMAAIFVNGNIEPVKWTFGWGKLFETNSVSGDTSSGYGASDDSNLYVAAVEFAPAKDMALGLNFYYLQDDSGRSIEQGKLNPTQALGHPVWGTAAINNFTADVYTPGVNFGMNAGPVKLSAFAFYQMGEFKSTVAGVEDIDLSAFVVDVRGDMKLGSGALFVEGLYVSGGDGGGNDYEAPITLGDYQVGGTATGGHSGFGRTHMYFLFGYDSVNISQCLIGCSGGEYGDSLGNSGRGLWHVAAGYSQKFTEKLKGEVNIGYLSASDLYAADEAAGKDKDMGTELNLRLDYTINKGLSASLAGALLKLGDFADPAENFEDTYYMGYARLNYSF